MKHTDKTPLQRFIAWREKHIADRTFIIILSIVVGLLSAFAALVLHGLIDLISGALSGSLHRWNFLYLLYPMVGILLCGIFIRRVVRDDIGHGVTRILYAISRKQARIRSHNMWSSVVASSVTIGFGGSVGAEAPIVLTGSAIGSNLGSLFRLSPRDLMLLVGCGAAGAVSGIFKAPIAGLVFTIEVLMIDLNMASLVPLLLSSVTAATVSYLVRGMDSMFHFNMSYPFILERTPYVILLGIVCGFVSLYFSETMNSLESFFGRLLKPWRKFLFGGVLLAVLIFFLPSLYGEGYDTINILLSGEASRWHSVMQNSFFASDSTSMLLLYLGLVLLLKVFASTATNGAGGCGGIFAPSLFLGCITGFIFAHFSNHLPFTTYMPEENFALFGMAGLMSGVMHAPLTGIFLIAELTGGYDLFLPLMIVSTVSFITIRIFQPHSIYSMRLAKKGELLTHHKDKSILTLMSTANVVETDFARLAPDMDLGQITGVISRSHRNLFPVVGPDGKLQGIVWMDDIRNLMFRTELYHRYTADRLMKEPATQLLVTDSMDAVMTKFDETHAWNLPVADEQGLYVGFVSRSKIFNEYRQLLVDLSDE